MYFNNVRNDLSWRVLMFLIKIYAILIIALPIFEIFIAYQNFHSSFSYITEFFKIISYFLIITSGLIIVFLYEKISTIEKKIK
jgi:hypothetical protein